MDAVWTPARRAKGDFFQGWYFKCQSETHTLAVIPAVHSTGGVRSCSVQLLTETGQWSVPFPTGRLSARGGRLRAEIGGCRFRESGLLLDLQGEGLSARGELRFGPLSPLRYDIMGPFRFVPFLECRHSVFSMGHTVDGQVRINGTDYRFQGGEGYLEGDRGRSFPRRYVWSQCALPGGSLMLSAADIPLGPVSFTGTTCAILWRGQEYRLATYLGARVQKIGGGEVVIRQGDSVLTARLLEREARPLQAPHSGAMTRTIHENAACRAYYRFQAGGRTLFAFETARAAFEYEWP